MLTQFQFWEFLAGLGMFLLGMTFLENALNALAGRTFKTFLRKHTAHPVKALLAGVVVTALLQSSSVVSLMVLAFVGARIIELRNALGIILGSNLGTTFTGWLVAYFGFEFEIESFAFPFLGIGALAMVFFSEKEKILESGRFSAGFGLMFLGLDFMKSSIEQLATTFDIAPYIGGGIFVLFLVGFVLTAIIQSSSAATVIALSALSAGMISLEAAAAMVLGNDLGTTIKIVVGGIKGSPAKKRVALSSFLFNLIVDVGALALIFPILKLVVWMFGDGNPLITLVGFHSTVNLLGILLFLPFINFYTKWVERFFQKDDSVVARFISNIPNDVAEVAVEGLRKEVRHLIDRVFWLHVTLLEIHAFRPFNKSEFITEETPAGQYEALKELEGEIVTYDLNVQSRKLQVAEVAALHQYLEAVRHSMSAAKAAKDIGHNIREFQRSGNESKHTLFELMRRQQADLFGELYRIFEATDGVDYFAALSELRHESKRHYNTFLERAAPMIRDSKFTDFEVSTLFNVNRELHQGNKALINALKDLLLTRAQAADFEKAD